MERTNKINAMLENGKITKEQARLLKDALEKSNKNKKEIQNITTQERQSNKNGFYIISAFFLFSIFIAIAVTSFSITSINRAGNGIKYDSTSIENLDTQKPTTQQNNLLRMEKRQIRKKITAVLFAGIFFSLFLLSLCLFSILSYNRLIKTKEDILECWFSIRIDIKRKLDLIPELLKILSQASSHETDIIERISSLRSRLSNTIKTENQSFTQINETISDARELISSISALVEGYPDLKANSAFMFLLNALVEIENSIAGQRQFYNKNINIFNKKTKSFPGNLFAGLFKINEHDYADSLK